MGRSKFPMPERFWRKLDRSGSCWTWTGHRNKDGYGRTWCVSRLVLAHRLAYELTHGPIDPAVKVLHRCDNPPCCNPDHLFLGTQADNVMDAAAKGHMARRGASNHATKITASQVTEIRAKHARGALRSDIAREYGLSWGSIDRVVRNETWRESGAAS